MIYALKILLHLLKYLYLYNKRFLICRSRKHIACDRTWDSIFGVTCDRTCDSKIIGTCDRTCDSPFYALWDRTCDSVFSYVVIEVVILFLGLPVIVFVIEIGIEVVTDNL